MVSLIVPCYNVAEHKLQRMMNSILSQDYPNIEVILVDDGSLDDTLSRLYAWKEAIIQKGYRCVVRKKEHGGVASAINVGLSSITGDFVCFPDADDALEPNYVSAMATYLDVHPQDLWVRCAYRIRNDDESERDIKQHPFRGDQLFEEMLLANEDVVVWRMMVRREYLLDKLSESLLYESINGTQEWQLMLPLSYHSRAAELNLILYNYYVYSDSYVRRHAVDEKSYSLMVRSMDECKFETLRHMLIPCNEHLLYCDMGDLGTAKYLQSHHDTSEETMLYCASQVSLLYQKYFSEYLDPTALCDKIVFWLYARKLTRHFLSIQNRS